MFYHSFNIVVKEREREFYNTIGKPTALKSEIFTKKKKNKKM